MWCNVGYIGGILTILKFCFLLIPLEMKNKLYPRMRNNKMCLVVVMGPKANNISH